GRGRRGPRPCTAAPSPAAEARRRSGSASRRRPPTRSCLRCRWRGRKGALNACTSSDRLLARAAEALLLLSRAALCYRTRHAPDEKIDQEPQQGEKAGAEAQARAAQEGAAAGDAGTLTGYRLGNDRGTPF